MPRIQLTVKMQMRAESDVGEDLGVDVDDSVDGASDAGEDVGPDALVDIAIDAADDVMDVDPADIVEITEDVGLDIFVDSATDAGDDLGPDGATDAGADDVGPADIAGDVTIADGFIDSDGDGVLDSSGIDGGVDGSTDSGDAGGDTPDVPVPPTCDGEPLGTINQPYPYDPKTLGKGVCVSGLDICGLEKSTGKAIGNRFSLRSAQLQKHAMVKTTIVTG